MSFVSNPFAIIKISVFPFEGSLTLSFVFDPYAGVLVSVVAFLVSLAMSHVIVPHAGVIVPVVATKSSIAVSLVVIDFANVGAIRIEMSYGRYLIILRFTEINVGQITLISVIFLSPVCRI